jgi:hypothetical protein
MADADEQRIVEHCTQAVERRTDGWLAEKQLLRHPGDIALEHQVSNTTIRLMSALRSSLRFIHCPRSPDCWYMSLIGVYQTIGGLFDNFTAPSGFAIPAP